MHKRVFATLVVVGSCLLALGQDFRTTTIVNSNSAAVPVDLTTLPSSSGGVFILRNSSASPILLPQIGNIGTSWPYDFAHIQQQLPHSVSDQDLAIAAWQYVVNHNFHLCSAGTGTANGKLYLYDPVLELSGFGFGCCDQVARELAWIWSQLGYPARIAVFNFHTDAELYYGNAWHLFDPDHEVYYLEPDGQTIASVADVLANPDLVLLAADANGNDPVDFPASLMATLYAQNASSLVYNDSGYYANSGLSVTLRPQEQMAVSDENLVGLDQEFDYGNPYSFKEVGTAQFRWDLTFADNGWVSNAYDTAGVSVIPDQSGTRYLVNSSSSPGYVVYQESSLFPVLTLNVSAQVGPGGGNLYVYFSTDGSNWSEPVQLQTSLAFSAYQLTADLTSQASGQYTYYVKFELHGAEQVHRLRIQPVVQMAKWMSPSLQAGAVNSIVYSDSSPAAQSRKIELTTQIPQGSPRIRGVAAESLIKEDPIYSLAADYGAANLVDDNPDTLAYPGSRHIDYAIHLHGLYNVTAMSIDWMLFGSDSRYVQSWTIYGRIGSDEAWQPLASGGPPGQNTTDLPLSALATDLRIVAESSNWIGIYDVRIFGNEQPSLPASMLTVTANVQEDPAYSSSPSFQRSNLVDRDISTLAYPGTSVADYSISVGGTASLNAVVINWGTFGTNPIYISSWSLLGRNGAQDSWHLLDSGAFPNGEWTTVGVNTTVTDVRLIADSSQNWIGVYDVRIYGTPQPAVRADSTISTFPEITGLSAVSNVIEWPTESGFAPASNVVDGNDNSLAYPVSSTFDYTIDLGGDIYVDSVLAVWGYFGSNPIYYSHWQLYGLRKGVPTWEVINSGTFPEAPETRIAVQNHYTKLRIAADSAVNWIGMYEIHVFGLQ